MPPLVIPALVAVTTTVGSSFIGQKQQKKAAKNAEDLAREQQQTAMAEQQRLEEKYGLTPGELAREQRLFGIPEGEQPIKISEGLEEGRQKELERRGKLTGEELLREAGPITAASLDDIARRQGMTGEELLQEIGPNARAILNEIAQRSSKTGEELFKGEGDIPQALQDQILAETRDPAKFYEDTLAPQLELARQMVNAEANKRGVFGGTPEGGIRFENLGRVGVDLAIKSASEKMAQRQRALSNASTLASIFQNLSAEARGESATVAERAFTAKEGVRGEMKDISGKALTAEENARIELDQFLANLQNQTAGAKGRAASVATSAAGTLQPQVSQGYQNLIGIEGYKGTIKGPAQAGLETIGQIAADYLGSKLPNIENKSSISGGDYGGGTLSAERQAGAKYDPSEYLSESTGSWLKRKKKYGSETFM